MKKKMMMVIMLMILVTSVMVVAGNETETTFWDSVVKFLWGDAENRFIIRG